MNTPVISLPRLAALRPRKLLGLRLAALLEIGVALGLLLLVDALLAPGHRLHALSPHPFWAVVLLAASYYGSREGLCAAVLAALALVGTGIAHDGPAVPMQALAWCVAALVLGELRDALRRRADATQAELARTRQQLAALTQAYERLHGEKDHLESRIAGQLCTVYAMYNASRAIERPGVGDVLAGVSELVRTVMNPEKSSLFLLSGRRLQATVSEGWTADDPFAREFDATTPLYRAVMFERRVLVSAQRSDQAVLRDDGVLAGPVVDGDSGEVVGMLKIEAIGFLDLHPASVQNFRILCDWIGAALTNARRVERLRDGAQADPAGRLQSAAAFGPQVQALVALADQVGFPAWMLNLHIDRPGAPAAATDAQVAGIVAAHAAQRLGPHQPCGAYGSGAWHYAVLLPGLDAPAAQALAQEFQTHLGAALAGLQPPVQLQHRLVPLAGSAAP